MRVWVDVLTPKQILFFNPAIRMLRDAGHEVLATSRRFREVEQLASMVGLELTFVGARAGKDPAEQFKASLARMASLLPIVSKFNPGVAVSVASYDCARIAYGLRFKHVAVNDSPHSVVAGRLSLPLSSLLLTPWVIPYSAWRQFGIGRKDILRYRAIDPAAWLKRRSPGAGGPPPVGLDQGKRTLLVRVEEAYAPYLIGSDEGWTDRVLNKLVNGFPDLNIVVLCRYDDQLRSIRKKFGKKLIIPEAVLDGAAMIEASDVFLGMGGTMTAEAALMGVPAISAFQGAELYTERYLLSEGLLKRLGSVARLNVLIENALETGYRRQVAARARRVLDSMEDPAEAIVRALVNMASEKA